MKICIDAGHYGKINRSPVVKTYYESEMNWKLHLLLKKYLEEYGVEVITTRAKQTKDLRLLYRGRAAKGCDLFLSIHSNACDDESVDRPVAICFVDDNCSSIDEESKTVATLLGNVIQAVMETKGKAQVYWRGHDRDGDGKKDEEYYGVLLGAHQVGVPGVILEHSFHTNTRAAKWLLDDSNLDKLAKAEADVIAAHYGLKKSNTIYRVQIGAYTLKANAEAALKKAKAAGFTDAFITETEV